MRQKRRIIFASFIALALASLPTSASAVTEVISPPTETTINGIPESQIVTPMDVIAGPYFYSYTQNTTYVVNKFKKIASYTHDNTRNTQSFSMEVTITNSTAQGSEWSGNIQFTGEIKLGIMGKVGATIGGSYKETRTTNEAVGIKGGPLIVQPGKIGHIDMYYRGRATGGTLRTYTFNTANLQNRAYTDTLINATFYPADFVDVYSEAWQS